MGKDEGIEKEQRIETAGEEGPLAETPEEEIKRLTEQLEAASREVAANYDKYLRAVAELDNYRKRADKEKSDAITFANEKLIEEMIPVIDNFDRALAHASGEDSLEALKQGIGLISGQMAALIRKFGIQEIKAAGEKFDPSMHHAISEEDSATAEPGTVVKEFQKGYLLKGRLLRPAMVAVSRKPEVH
jgi:molecular chaperone GrpE